MKFMKPLNTKGFGHVELVVAVLFIGLFAFVGVRIIGTNHADPLTATNTSTKNVKVSGKCAVISPTSITAGVLTSDTIVRFTNTGKATFTIAYDTAGSVGSRGAGYTGTYTSAGTVAPGAYKDVTVAAGGTYNLTDKGSIATIYVKNQAPSFTCTKSWTIL